ncbi:MAG: acyl-CoA dehydrogenase [Deltaproteobacteria bacterium]|jgi:alkylation response protein AidB-like acyl-CoA dehydrogenase|nr:MAG: acyl-CoA dehydrogenase [Deltaproteobacteria bacterium]
MDFKFTEEQEILKKSVRNFMDKECPREYVRELDEKEEFPFELYKKMAKLGWYGLPFPEEYGGSGCGPLDFIMVGEELCRFSYEIGAGYGVPIFNALTLLHHGSEEQKNRYIPKVVNGEMMWSIALTEPNAGSDVASLVTSAVPEGDEFVVNGQKVFITGADVANIMTMAVRTDKDLPRHKGISMLLVDPKSPGIDIRIIKTLGRKIIHATELFLEDVRVPKGNLIGELNGGWDVLMSGLELERLFACAGYVGNAQTVVDDALDHAKQRVQFGRPIGTFQAIGHMLADMQTEVDAARLLTYRAAWMVEQGIPCIREVSMAKLFGSESLARLTNQGMQIMGGYGYSMEYDMQRYFRDARIITVSAGSSQMQRTIIAKQMGLKVV